MRPLAADRSMTLRVDRQIETDLHLLADRQRLKQVLLNLLTNAVKYTPVGGRVTVSVERSNPATTRLIVRDTGGGIAPEKLARVLTPLDPLGGGQARGGRSGLRPGPCPPVVASTGGGLSV